MSIHRLCKAIIAILSEVDDIPRLLRALQLHLRHVGWSRVSAFELTASLSHTPERGPTDCDEKSDLLITLVPAVAFASRSLRVLG